MSSRRETCYIKNIVEARTLDEWDHMVHIKKSMLMKLGEMYAEKYAKCVKEWVFSKDGHFNRHFSDPKLAPQGWTFQHLEVTYELE